MTRKIKEFIESQGLLICPSCGGEGEFSSFCGHETTENCYDCGGKGIIKSLKKQRHQKDCAICKARIGGCGGCNFHPKGLIEWESYEII